MSWPNKYQYKHVVVRSHIKVARSGCAGVCNTLHGDYTQECLRTMSDMLAMLKAALTGCNLSGPLAPETFCVTLQIPAGSRDKVTGSSV